MLIYAKKVLSPDPNRRGREEAVEERNATEKVMSAIASTRRFDSGNVSLGSFAIQTFPMHMIHFVGNIYKHATLFINCLRAPCLQRSDKWYGCFYITELKFHLVLDRPAKEITVKE